MDIAGIPKTFWHAVSVSILALTFGLLLIAYRSANVTIEIANTKIVLSKTINETERLNEDLKKEASRLERVRVGLNQKVAEFDRALMEAKSWSPEYIKSLRPKMLDLTEASVSIKQFEDIGRNLQHLQSKLADR